MPIVIFLPKTSFICTKNPITLFGVIPIELNIPAISNELPTNGHNKNYYKLSTNSNGLNAIDTKLATLTNELNQYAINSATSLNTLNQKEAAYKDALDDYINKNANYTYYKEQYDSNVTLFKAGLNNDITATVARIQNELGTDENPDSLRGERAIAWNNYETENDKYLTKLNDWNEALREGQWYVSELDKYDSSLQELYNSLNEVNNNITAAQNELALAQQEGDQNQIEALENRIEQLENQRDEIQGNINAQTEIKDSIEQEYNNWRDTHNLNQQESELQVQEQKKNTAYSAWQTKDNAVHEKEKELADAQYLQENLETELERLANSLLTVGPKVLGPNDTNQLLLSYNKDLPLANRASWGTASAQGDLLKSKNDAQTQLSGAETELLNAREAYGRLQENYNKTQKDYDDLNYAYITYKNAYQDYIDNIDNNGDGSIIITNQGPSTSNRISIGKKFSVNGEGKIKSTGGTIGGWIIDDTSLHTGTNSNGTGSGNIWISSSDFNRTIGGTNRTGLRFAIGGNFAVDKNGNLYANNATINGTIYASAGRIGGWDISSDRLSGNGIISGGTITGSTITGNTITGGTISGTTISGNTISGGSISGTTISGTAISGGSISGATISGNTITGGTISGADIYCTGLNVNGAWYSMTDSSVITDISWTRAGYALSWGTITIPSYSGTVSANGQTVGITIPAKTINLPITSVAATHISSTTRRFFHFLGTVRG